MPRREVACREIDGRWVYVSLHDAPGNDGQLVYGKCIPDNVGAPGVTSGYLDRSEIQIMGDDARRVIVFDNGEPVRVRSPREIRSWAWSDAQGLFNAVIWELERIGVVPIGTHEEATRLLSKA